TPRFSSIVACGDRTKSRACAGCSRQTSALYAANVRPPYVFVRLELQPHRQAVGENPGRELASAHDAVDRREQHRGGLRHEVVARHDVPRELVVGAVLDDELDLVGRPQTLEVGPVHLVGFAAAGAFHVDHAHDAVGYLVDAEMAAGFEHDG